MAACARSFIIFCLAAILIFLKRPRVQAIVLAVAAAALAYKSPYYLAFILGVVLAWGRVNNTLEVPATLAIPLLVTALYLLGYGASVGAYAWLPAIPREFLHCLAAFLLIVSVGFCPALRKHLDGSVGKLLGRYSFPIYLTHCLMIMSVGMIAFVSSYPLCGYAASSAISILASLAATIAASHLLSLFEARWLAALNFAAGSVINYALIARSSGCFLIDCDYQQLSLLLLLGMWETRLRCPSCPQRGCSRSCVI